MKSLFDNAKIPYKLTEIPTAKEMDMDNVHTVEVVIPLAEKYAMIRLHMAFTDAELPQRGIMDGKRNAVIDQARKLFEEGRAEFIAQLPETQVSAPQTQAPATQAASAQAPTGSSNPLCPICNVQQTFKSAGVSRTTGKAYTGFWACPNYKAHPSK